MNYIDGLISKLEPTHFRWNIYNRDTTATQLEEPIWLYIDAIVQLVQGE